MSDLKSRFGDVDFDAVRKRIAEEIVAHSLRLSGFEKQFFDSIPSKYKYQMLKAKKGLLSHKSVVKLNCIHCRGWSLKEAMLCTAKMCPMFAYRPKPKAKEKAD